MPGSSFRSQDHLISPQQNPKVPPCRLSSSKSELNQALYEQTIVFQSVHIERFYLIIADTTILCWIVIEPHLTIKYFQELIFMATHFGYTPPEKSYKCMVRHIPQDSSGYFCYTLTSFAKCNFSFINLYLLYFPSCYTRQHYNKLKSLRESSNRIQNQAIGTDKIFSIFFKTFCRLMVLHAILGWQDKSYEFAAGFPYEFVHNSPLEQAHNEIAKRMMAQICKQYQYLFGEPQNRGWEWPQAKEIMKEMQNVIQKIVKEAEPNPFLILANQQFLACQNQPSFLSHLIRRNLERITNIHVFRKEKKKQMLQSFQEKYGSLFHINIPFLKDDKDTTKEDKIYMLRDTNEKEPIITSLPIYLKNINNPNPQVNMALAQQIIKLFHQFMENTKLPFPNLKVSSILIDQKRLAPVYDQGLLILDAIGTLGNTNTFQLDLAISATPTAIELEKSHLEYKDEVRWSILRKYYEKKRIHTQEDDSNHSKIQQVEQSSIQEQVHVWRLLCVIYAVFKVKTGQPQALAHKIYQDHYQQQPFYKECYVQAAEHVFKSCLNGKDSIKRLLNINSNLLQAQKGQKFSFTMPELAQKFQLSSEQDSLLNNLKFEALLVQISFRIKIIQQISSMLNKHFKKFFNVKKYILMYLIQSSQNLYQSALYADLEESWPGSCRKLIQKLPRYSTVSIYEESRIRKSNLPKIFEKLNSYKTRKLEGSYLNKKKDIIDTISGLPQRQTNIEDYEKTLSSIGFYIKNDTKPHHLVKQYAQYLNQIKKNGCQSFYACMNALQIFRKDEIDSRLSNLQEFHKMDDLTKQAATLLSLRLSLFIQAYCRLRPQNWKGIQLLIEPVFNRLHLMKKAMHSSQQPQMLKFTQLQIYYIQKRLSNYEVQTLSFHHGDSPRIKNY